MWRRFVLLAATAHALQFPTRATPPATVLAAQLDAFRACDVDRAYDLFSRARRLAIDEAAMSDVRASYRPRDFVIKKLEEGLRESCPSLVGHDRHEILSGLAISDYDGVHLPKWRCRVRVASAAKTRSYLFHLTRQSDPPPPTIEFNEAFDYSRAIDGFEGCWFIDRIEPEDGGTRVSAPLRPRELVPA